MSVSKRQIPAYDPKLDRLYMKSVKCPYCKNKIRSMQTTCDRCGLSKMQIANASGQKAKEIIREKSGDKIVMMKKRPADIKMSALAPRMLFGIFGVHNFYTGRRIRGFIMLGLMLFFMLEVMIFSFGDFNNGLAGMHPWREVCNNWGVPFPLDFLGLAAFVMWVADCFGIVFGWYKYPVRLGDNNKNA